MQRAKTIKVVGQDPSLRSWGLAQGTYCLETGEIQIDQLKVIKPVLPTGKQVRQNSLDLESSMQLYAGAAAFSKDAQATFVEVPVGSQSARAMASYALCVGVLGSMRANGIQFQEVTATEVKLAGYGHKNATKGQMIEWARSKHPNAGWPTYMEHGQVKISESIAEHMADAVAAIYAGVRGNQFQQLLSLLTAKP